MKTSKLRYLVFGLIAVILAAFVALSLTGCPPGEEEEEGSKHDIDSALYGTWKNSAGSLTVTFSSDGITWGGNVGSSYNNLPVDKWTAKNGAISTTYQGSTTTVWNYTVSSDELELTSPTTGTKHTLYKEGSASASKHDIDTALYGKYEKENDSNSLTVDFSSGGIYWGGTVGSMYNSLSVDKWTAKNGQITTTYQGSTTTVWNYTMSSGKLVLTSPTTGTTHTLVKTEGISGDYRYQITDATVTIIGYSGPKDGAVTIPSTIDGKTVTAIEKAFHSGSWDGSGEFFPTGQLTSVNIPNSVITIGFEAFQGNKLTSITIPNSVIYIGQTAFAYNQLTSVTIPNSVTTIDRSAFIGNPLTNITVDSGNTVYSSQNLFLLSKDGKELFAYYGSSKSITIPNSVTTIGEWVLAKNKLTSVVIPNNVTDISWKAFEDNPLTSVTIGANVMLWSSFPGDFDNVYETTNSKAAGTYIFTGTITTNEYGGYIHTGSWSKQ